MSIPSKHYGCSLDPQYYVVIAPTCTSVMKQSPAPTGIQIMPFVAINFALSKVSYSDRGIGWDYVDCPGFNVLVFGRTFFFCMETVFY